MDEYFLAAISNRVMYKISKQVKECKKRRLRKIVLRILQENEIKNCTELSRHISITTMTINGLVPDVETLIY